MRGQHYEGNAVSEGGINAGIRATMIERMSSAILCIGLRSHRHECESEYPCIRVARNTSLHVFQRRPFTLIRVLYVLYGLAVNFTRTSSFCAGRVFIQPVRSEQHKICINLIYTGHDAYLTS